MKIQQLGFALIGLFLFTATGCNEPAESATTEKSKPYTLSWEELMPEGEEELLDRMHEEFYADLDRRIAQADRMTLSEAARNGDFGVISEGSALDEMPQLGTFNAVEELDGAHVRLPGFIVPIEYEAEEKLRSFLLVPYFGACIHTPPPPPNQIVFVTSDKAINAPALWDAYWVEGTLHIEKLEHELGNTAYSMELLKLKPYDE